MKTTWQSLFNGIFALLAATASAFDAGIEQTATDTMTISWPSITGRQYQVYSNDSLPVGTSNPVGVWQVGNGSVLSIGGSMGSDTKQFYSVVERVDFEVNTSGFGYDTIGNSWTYNVTDSRESSDYEVTLTAMGIQAIPELSGQQVYVVEASSLDHPLGNAWEQALYISTDFSGGIYQVGGISAESTGDSSIASGFFEITGAAMQPLILSPFSPGVTVDADYVHSFFNTVDNTIRHTLTTYTLPGASTPTLAILVRSVFQSTILVEDPQGTLENDVELLVDYVVEDTYVPNVGIVHKLVDVDAVPVDPVIRLLRGSEYIDVTYTLTASSLLP